MVKPWGAEAALKTDLVAFFIGVREGAAGQVARRPTLQVYLALRAAQCWRRGRVRKASEETLDDRTWGPPLATVTPSYISMVPTFLFHS